MVDDIERTVMPKTIAKGIVEVIKTLGVLGKDNKNDFDKYKYASIDDFIKFVRQDCAKQGLFFIPNEAREPEIIGTKKKDGKDLAMWWSRFAFTIGHEEGDTYGPIYKTVMVQASGAQAAGSAQSYALKQLMRALFLIPTGDGDDPDNKGTAEMSVNNNHVSSGQKIAQKILDKIKKAKTIDALNNLWEEATLDLEDIKANSDKAYPHLSNAFDKKKIELENK